MEKIIATYPSISPKGEEKEKMEAKIGLHPSISPKGEEKEKMEAKIYPNLIMLLIVINR